MNAQINRRQFLQASSGALAGLSLAGHLPAAETETKVKDPLKPKADSVILIWLPGGVAQTDTWDTKRFTPYRQGMKGNELLSTCESIPTAADGIRLGQGLENLATVMDQATVLRSLTNKTKFGAVHLRAQYYMMTGYIPPVGVKAPSIGSIVARTRGRRHPYVPGYIYLGRDIDTSDEEKLFINEYIGSGFYGINYAPFMIPEPDQGLPTLQTMAGMDQNRFDRRLAYLRGLVDLSGNELHDSPKANAYLKMIEDARGMMDSPVKKAFDFARYEKPETLAAYQSQVSPLDLLDKSYYNGDRFGPSLLLARRLVEAGARFVQVEYQYGPFKGFDTHENGRDRLFEMKKQVDRPVAQLIRDLKERGLLERTLVIVATEFGRTIASAPSAGKEPEGFAEHHNGSELVIENEAMYGLHGHFSSCSSMLFFGGGFKKGFVYGKTAPEHPMIAIENPVTLEDVHATIYKALGIPADTMYETEGRPFYVTNNGKGQPIEALLA